MMLTYFLRFGAIGTPVGNSDDKTNRWFALMTSVEPAIGSFFAPYIAIFRERIPMAPSTMPRYLTE